MQVYFLVLLMILLGACAGHQPLPPALPAEPTLFIPPEALDPLLVPPSPALPQEAPPVSVPPVAEAPVAEQPAMVPSVTELQEFLQVQDQLDKPETPAKVIESANAKARLAPTRRNYADGTSAIQRYPYMPGRIYDIYTAPESPTLILLPPGERMTASLSLNPDAWIVGAMEMPDGEQYQQAIVVRAVAANLVGSTHLVLQSGAVLPLRFQSFKETSMAVVTWQLPPKVFAVKPEAARIAQPPQLRPPIIDVTRVHTAYSVEVTSKNVPAWVPMSVFDDGQKTLIRFKESLQYTRAPGLAAVNADGTPGAVQWNSYSVPGAPEKGQYYVVTGLWPLLRLVGSDGEEVTITRQTGQVKPYVVQK